jgi:4'-phosphopantetheinyl transferase
VFRTVTSALATIASTAAVLDSVPDAVELLTDVERGRAARLRRVSDRDGFVAAHVLVRLCAAYLFGLPATTTLQQHCAACGGPHGPAHLRELPEVGLSISHAEGVVAAAVAPVPVGVDVEPLASAAAAAESRVVAATPAERRRLARMGDGGESFLMLWVRKEALVKLGRTTLEQMAEVSLYELPPTLPRAGQHRRHRWAGYSIVDLSLTAPPAVGAVVSECEIDVVPYDEVRAGLP